VLSADDIREWASQFASENKPSEVLFASEPDAIVKVYENGPSSCMDGAHMVSNCTRVYGAGDLAVAYITTNGEESATARCVCWPAKLIYSTIYGDSGRLAPALQALGYKSAERGAYEGARLLYIEEDGGIVAPYWDGSGNGSVEGTYPDQVLVIRENGEHELGSTSGVIGGTQCYSCGSHYDSDEEGSYYNDEPYCQSCAEDELSYCEGCDETCRSEDMVCVPGDGVSRAPGAGYNPRQYERYLCSDCADNETGECEHCNERAYTDAMITTSDGETYCAECGESELACCERCDDWEKSEDCSAVVNSEGDSVTWCDSCADDYANDCEACGERNSDVTTDEPHCADCKPAEEEEEEEEEDDSETGERGESGSTPILLIPVTAASLATSPTRYL
jgi:hypothetical protein